MAIAGFNGLLGSFLGLRLGASVVSVAGIRIVVVLSRTSDRPIQTQLVQFNQGTGSKHTPKPSAGISWPEFIRYLVDRLNCDMMEDVLKRGYLERKVNEDTGRD